MSNDTSNAFNPVSYEEILHYDPLVFLNYLGQFIQPVSFNVESQEEMKRAANELGSIASKFTVLSTLYAYAGVIKRSMGRNGKTSEYEDMIDRERILETYLKTLDMQYRALTKGVNVHMEANRELYYTDGIGPRKNG